MQRLEGVVRVGVQEGKALARIVAELTLNRKRSAVMLSHVKVLVAYEAVELGAKDDDLQHGGDDHMKQRVLKLGISGVALL